MERLIHGFAGAVLAGAVAQLSLAGAWALSGGKPMTAAHMNLTYLATDRVTLDIYETNPGASTPIRSYDVDMSKLMHVIVIDSDFTEFIHAHPAFDAASGHFSLTLQLYPTRRYYVYADAEPKGLGQQVFRFTIQPLTRQALPEAAPAAAQTPSPNQNIAGPYLVELSRTTLAAGRAQAVDITVTKSGKPASDLIPYLGAAAHAVFIDTATLAYVHVHPTLPGGMDPDMPGMDMGSMHMDDSPKAAPHMVMHVPALPAGSYKLWLQFQGKTGLAVAPFTLVAR